MVLLLTQNPYRARPREANGLWFPRTPPIQAKYNGYGRIEDIHPGDAIVCETWLEGFKLDLVERGWGPNKYHDPPAKKTWTFEQFMETLWEGRVRVHDAGFERAAKRLAQRTQELTGAKDKLPPGVVTRRRLEKLLSTYPLYNGGEAAGFAVTRAGANECRVRWVSYDQAEVARQLACVAPVVSLRYPCVITGEAENHGHPVLRVFSTVEDTAATPPVGKSRKLQVQSAMIREDVWRIMVNLSHLKDWDEQAQTYAAEVEQHFKMLKERPQPLDFFDIFSYTSGNTAVGEILVRTLPFQVGVGKHLSLLHDKGRFKKRHIRVMGEFAAFTESLHRLRMHWQPSYPIGPQSSDWADHAAHLACLKFIADSGLDAQVKARASWLPPERGEGTSFSARANVKSSALADLTAYSVRKLGRG